MSLSGYIDSAYAATRMTFAEELAWARQHACKREGCDAPVDESKKCGICDEYFCPMHLTDGFCMRCYFMDAAAEEMAEQMDKEAA